MKIEYDKKLDTKYVRIMRGKIAKTKQEKDWLLFDLAKNGNVLGIEILDATKHPISIYAIDGKFVGYDLSDKKLQVEKLKLIARGNKDNYDTEVSLMGLSDSTKDMQFIPA